MEKTQRTARIWTECFEPFRMGGDVRRPIATTVAVGAPVRLAKSVSVYVVESPKGTTHIVEKTSGAFVGTDLDAVRRDVLAGSPDVMRKQIADAIERGKYAVELEPTEFWAKFR